MKRLLVLVALLGLLLACAAPAPTVTVTAPPITIFVTPTPTNLLAGPPSGVSLDSYYPNHDSFSTYEYPSKSIQLAKNETLEATTIIWLADKRVKAIPETPASVVFGIAQVVGNTNVGVFDAGSISGMYSFRYKAEGSAKYLLIYNGRGTDVWVDIYFKVIPATSA